MELRKLAFHLPNVLLQVVTQQELEEAEDGQAWGSLGHLAPTPISLSQGAR